MSDQSEEKEQAGGYVELRRYTSKELVSITEEQRIERGRELAEALDALEAHEEHTKAIRAELKRDESELRMRVAGLRNVVRDGMERRPLVVRVCVDKKTMLVHELHSLTGAVLTRRGMDEHEVELYDRLRQESLPLASRDTGQTPAPPVGESPAEAHPDAATGEEGEERVRPTLTSLAEGFLRELKESRADQRPGVLAERSATLLREMFRLATGRPTRDRIDTIRQALLDWAQRTVDGVEPDEDLDEDLPAAEDGPVEAAET